MPEVQFLRDFRERLVLSTFAGRSFMSTFNAWYYSFSPFVAGFISEHPAAGEIMQTFLRPLVGVLRISSQSFFALELGSETVMIIGGLMASSLIGIVYLLPVMIVITSFRTTRRKCVNKRTCRRPSQLLRIRAAKRNVDELFKSNAFGFC
jgi:hypothetical protein